MKIMTLGISPYINMSHARIHAIILKHIYYSHHEVACIAMGHDTTYFLPKDDDQGNPRYYYTFDKHDIPLVPVVNQKEPAIMIYEIIKVFQPDMIVTVGDFIDHPFMKAVKMFSDTPIKWVAILANASYPINESKEELLEDMDGILCTNNDSFEMISKLFKKEHIFLSYVGSGKSLAKNETSDKFRIMSCGKNLQNDNLPMLMQVCSSLRGEIPNLELYLHSNIYDRGDYDLNLLKQRFDPNDEFIRFPEKYVSLIDGYSEDEYAKELSKSDIFASVSLSSSSGLSIFEALSQECLPLMTDVGAHRDIAAMLVDLCPNFQKNDFLVPSIEIMTSGEVYVNICKPYQLREKILKLHKKIKEGGYGTFSQEFINSHNRKIFLADVMNLIEVVKKTNSTICVEPV